VRNGHETRRGVKSRNENEEMNIAPSADEKQMITTAHYHICTARRSIRGIYSRAVLFFRFCINHIWLGNGVNLGFVTTTIPRLWRISTAMYHELSYAFFYSMTIVSWGDVVAKNEFHSIGTSTDTDINNTRNHASFFSLGDRKPHSSKHVM
jgi:hypothetical protein